MLRARPVVQAGDSVKLVYAGTGFTVSTEGKAAAQAANGQIVPIRTESGKMVNGIARSGGIAEVPNL
jgi:flagella basal body P-ring formation protein FlgA